MLLQRAGERKGGATLWNTKASTTGMMAATKDILKKTKTIQAHSETPIYIPIYLSTYLPTYKSKGPQVSQLAFSLI